MRKIVVFMQMSLKFATLINTQKISHIHRHIPCQPIINHKAQISTNVHPLFYNQNKSLNVINGI